MKELMQEWLCDNRHQIMECIGIALRNHELSYAEWFKYVDDKSGPDELALYSLSRKYGIHTSVYNKSYVWTTLTNHMSRTDEEIFKLNGVNLVYLGPTVYGIIRDICPPQTDSILITPKSSGSSSKRTSKVTCRDSTQGRKATNRDKGNTGCRGGGCGSRPQMLSESRRANYGISISNITPRKVRSSRQQIDYVSLNDGCDEEEPILTKRRHKESYQPRSAPSASRLSAHKRMSSPVSISVKGVAIDDTLTAVPSTSVEVPLTGIPSARADDVLPDLVVNHPNVPGTDDQLPVAMNTFEDLEAASMLLSLGDTLEDTPEEEEDNALLMPVGDADNPEDIAPQPLHLDQVSVDNVIAGLVETKQLEKDVADEAKNTTATVPIPIVEPADMQAPTDPPSEVQTKEEIITGKKGSLKTKTYVLKKKPEAKR